jgi:molybdenum cofactor cytidylyltransferase
MSDQPTVILLADPEMHWCADDRQAIGQYSVLDTALRRVLASQLPRVLVATPAQAEAAARLLPGQDILVLAAPDGQQSASDWLAQGVANAVIERGDSPGWVLLPIDMPMLRLDTLHAVAAALKAATMVFPCHRHLRGLPVGLSAELHSELIRVRNDQDLRRLTARYPGMDVDVDDAGVLMTMDAHTGLNQLRAQLTGPAMSALARSGLGVLSC